MPTDTTVSARNSQQTSLIEAYFLMSVILLLILIAVIFIGIVCHWFQCKRRNRTSKIWIAGTTCADRFHVDQDCYHIAAKSTKKEYRSCRHCSGSMMA